MDAQASSSASQQYREFDIGGHAWVVAGNVAGNVIFNAPTPTQHKPTPCSTVPFKQDSDFVDSDILQQLEQRCSQPASRVALFGLGGVGKSQLAIEYSYRLRKRSPDTWVFWVHAGSPARFEEGYKRIADQFMPLGWDSSRTDVLRLVFNWLSNEENGHWLMIIDNVDQESVLFQPTVSVQSSATASATPQLESLSKFIPQIANGSILITSRDKDAALRVTRSHSNIVEVKAMDSDRAVRLLTAKLGDLNDELNAKELADELD